MGRSLAIREQKSAMKNGADPGCGVLRERRHDVAVKIERDRRLGVPEALGDNLHRNAGDECQRRARVSKSVERDPLHARGVDETREDARGQVWENEWSAELRRTAREFHGEDEGAVLVRAPVPKLELGLGASVNQERVDEVGREIKRARPAALERDESPAPELVNDPERRLLGVEVLPPERSNLALTEPELERYATRFFHLGIPVEKLRQCPSLLSGKSDEKAGPVERGWGLAPLPSSPERRCFSISVQVSPVLPHPT